MYICMYVFCAYVYVFMWHLKHVEIRGKLVGSFLLLCGKQMPLPAESSIILLTLKHFKRVLNYFFLYVCIGEIHMHSGTCRDKRSTSDVPSKEASTLISETPSLTDSELTKYARLDYQRTPEVHQFPPPQLWERISTPMVGIKLKSS